MSSHLLLSLKWNLSSVQFTVVSHTCHHRVNLDTSPSFLSPVPSNWNAPETTKKEDLLPPVMYTCTVVYRDMQKYLIFQISQCGHCVHTCMAAWLVTHATGHHCVLLHNLDNTCNTLSSDELFHQGVYPAASHADWFSDHLYKLCRGLLYVVP